MLYILDAYNVIHRIPELESALDQDLRSARDKLIALCSDLVACRGDISKIILVFDGRSEFRDLPQPSLPKVKIVFSDTDEKADERICEVLENLPERPQRFVVSDDNFVRNHTRAYKATPMSVRDFQTLAYHMKKKPHHTDPKEAEALDPDDADAITQAYKKALGL